MTMPTLYDTLSTTHMTAKGVMGGAGAAVFGDHFEPGREVEKQSISIIFKTCLTASSAPKHVDNVAFAAEVGSGDCGGRTRKHFSVINHWRDLFVWYWVCPAA